MPHLKSKPPANDSTVVDTVCHYLYQVLVSLQQQHPEWLDVRYRSIPWHQSRYQLTFTQKITQGLSSVHSSEQLLKKAKAYLKTLSSEAFIQSPQCQGLIVKLEKLILPKTFTPLYPEPVEILPHQHFSNGQEIARAGISILLLDVENLQLDLDTEKFLETVCTYPIQIKAAFANWRSMGKKDLEFHQRGYQLIHVPPGKDSADLKMATVGSSIFVHYPTAKEVLVCSSDRALTHLCNTLQSHGLTVYQVKKKDDKILVFNSQTGHTQNFSWIPQIEIPTLAAFIQQLQALIRTEQKRTQSQWIKLSRLSALYKDTHNLTISQVVSTHFSDYRARDIFVNHPQYFVLHKPSKKSQTYISLFELKSPPEKLVIVQNEVNGSSRTITSVKDLEQALVEIMQELTANAETSCISLSVLGSYFNRKYGQAITQVIKKFQPGGKFTKFIDLCDSFRLEKTDIGWNVCLQPSTSSSSENNGS